MAIGRIPENILEEILNRVNIVELISEYIPLKRAGRNFKANCPFHQEKTPSFVVSPDRQIYHCFGCGQSGNAFKFLMSYDRMEFPEAVQTLAKKTGVTLPEAQKQDQQSVSLYTKLYKINELAASFYVHSLNAAGIVAAKNYLLERGIKEETVGLFKLGLAPDKWDGLMDYLRNKGINLSLLEKAGLILPRDNGGYYDRFRNRIVFPIFDIKSRVIGFGARLIPALNNEKAEAALPKYINSPETPIYIKGRNLYGLNLAKDAIRQNDYVAIVEGYLDFIIPYQEGLQNIVASLGTALTSEQARLLKRYTHNVVMVYDADDAGELATLRTLDIFIEEGMNVRVVSLPPGFDPDLFVRKNGMESFKERISQAENLFDYKLRILKSRYSLKDIESKVMISQEMLPTINRCKNAVLRSEYIKKLAGELDIEEDALLVEIKKIKEDKTYQDNGQTVQKKTINISPTERLLIKLMLEEREVIDRISRVLEPADFRDERTCRIVSVMFDLVSQGKDIEASSLINHFNEDEISYIICESTMLPEITEQDKDKIIDDCIKRIKHERIKLKKQHLHEQIKAAQHSRDDEQLQKLMQEFHCLTKVFSQNKEDKNEDLHHIEKNNLELNI